MKTALVFGASGQIGGPVLDRLSDAGWRVLAVSRQPQRDAAGVHWLRGDLARVDGLPVALDAVLSCGPLDLFAQWFAATPLALPRVVAFGSTSVHVKHASDDDAERAVAARLAVAEQQLFDAASARGVAATVLRPTLVYGVGRDATLTRIVQLARRYRRFVLPRRADGLRMPVHVQDLAAAAVAALVQPTSAGRAYDLPGGERIAYREMVRRALDCLQPPLPLHELPMPLYRGLLQAAQARGIAAGFTPAMLARMRQDLVFDDAAARHDLGWSPRAFRPDPSMFAGG